MNSPKPFTLFVLTFLGLCISFCASEVVPKPVIGILSTPSDLHDLYSPHDYSYIKNSYAEFIEAAGGVPVAIPWELPEHELIGLLDSLNGVLFTGGDATLWDFDFKSNDIVFSNFTKKAAFILHYVIHLNDKGIHYPLYGICQGHEVIAMGLVGTPHIIDHYRHPGQLDTVNVIEAGKTSRMFGGMADNVAAFMRDQRSVFYNHRYGFNMSLLEENEALNEFFIITAKGTDDNGREFIAAMEAKEYPIYTVQYHPERVLSESNNKTVFSHPDEAIQAILHQANFFVNEARKNQQTFHSEDIKKVFLLDSHEHVYLNITWPKTFIYDKKTPLNFQVNVEYSDCSDCDLCDEHDCATINVEL